MNPTLLKELIQRLLEGRATPAQRILIREALKAPENQRIYYESIHEWEQAHPEILPDPETEWHRIVHKLNKAPENVSSAPRETMRRLRWNRSVLWIAASIGLMILAVTQYSNLILYHQYQSDFGETRKINLPDGSSVILNANSKLLFSRLFFLSKNRQAILKGEAEFSIKHKNSHPFIVRTDDSLHVKVLGTQFLVYTRESRSKVVLTSGSIELSSLKTNSSPVLIKPGEVVDITNKGHFHIARSNRPEEHFLWKEKKFVFDKTPLREIAVQVSERFGISLIIPDSSLASMPITGNYQAETAEEMVGMLSTLLNLRSRKISSSSIVLQKN